MKRINPLPSLKMSPYVYEDSHYLLGADASSVSGPNIGWGGVNLTITCLSMNRVTLTEKLLNSIERNIPDFKGRVLIVDNGSKKGELEKLYAIVSRSSLNVDVVELGENYGVSGGRNRTIPHLRTPWAMFLDNDIYFISNPLPRLQKDLAQLGCHFINMPLLDSDCETLFAKGGNIYVSPESETIHVGAGSVCRQEKVSEYDGEGFLSTFLFGGASVVNVETFKHIGCYDENMFIGFEDIDFSIRLFQSGMKVGNCGAISLVHDHPKPTSDSDIDYERTRFTRDILKKSADYLENKHGMKFWSAPVDEWLDEKQRTLNVNSDDEFENFELFNMGNHAVIDRRPRIALVIDTENWAFSNIAHQLEKNLSLYYEFIIIPTSVIDNISQLLMMTKDCHITHFFWRESLRLIQDPYYIGYNNSIGYSERQFYDAFLDNRIITSSVYDHLFLSEDKILERESFYNDIISGYTVSSSKLYEIYKGISIYPNPSLIAEDGVDLSLFRPINIDRFNNLLSRPLIIGWAGNSKWAGELEDFKGYHSLLMPAVKKLCDEGLNIELHLADRQTGFIPHSEMVNYYSKIDVYICPSKIEGTPNPVLESMACGVPVISTDVGVVSDAFGPLQKEWILEERSLDALVDMLRDFYFRRDNVIPALSSENLKYIKSWDWSAKALNFKSFFDGFLDS